MKIFFVIAAYNEGNHIEKVIDEIRSAGYKDIVVVDDGSSDDTYSICKRQGVYVLRHIINRGQGAALKTGIDFALEMGADYICTFDADGQHRIEDFPALLEPVKSGKYDIALGSRFLKKTEMPFLRKIILKIGVLIIWFFYGLKMTDAHNGYRVMNRKAAELIEITSDRMEHASQIIEEIKRKKLRYVEVPVTIRYKGIRKGHGGITQAFKILWKMIKRKFL